MSLNFFVPFSGSKHTVKDYIIMTLSYSWPLTAKKLFNLLKKKYSLSVTYQAVYKTVNELLKNGVIERAGLEYKLNMKWIKNLHSYTELTESNYFTKNAHENFMGLLDSASNGAMNMLIFDKLFDVEKYLYYLQKNYILNSNIGGVICVHHNHEWRPLFYLRAEYNWVRKVAQLKGRTYVLCAGSTAMDKWCAKVYKSFGLKIKTGVHCAGVAELMVFGDLVIQIFLPDDIKNALDNYALKAESVTELNLFSLARDVFEKKSEIKVMITKDSKLAEQFKRETIKHFK